MNTEPVLRNCSTIQWCLNVVDHVDWIMSSAIMLKPYVLWMKIRHVVGVTYNEYRLMDVLDSPTAVTQTKAIFSCGISYLL